MFPDPKVIAHEYVTEFNVLSAAQPAWLTYWLSTVAFIVEGIGVSAAHETTVALKFTTLKEPVSQSNSAAEFGVSPVMFQVDKF